MYKRFKRDEPWDSVHNKKLIAKMPAVYTAPGMKDSANSRSRQCVELGQRGSARRFLATRTLDQILRDRNEITDAIREDVRASAQSYGVEILRADVKDLVFPGNLREIMNRVIETERESEASVIAASKAAQVARIKAEAEAVAAKDRLEADRAAAQLLVDNPQLVRLRELEVLREIGLAGGNQFFIGLDNLIGSTSIRPPCDHLTTPAGRLPRDAVKPDVGGKGWEVATIMDVPSLWNVGQGRRSTRSRTRRCADRRTRSGDRRAMVGDRAAVSPGTTTPSNTTACASTSASARSAQPRGRPRGTVLIPPHSETAATYDQEEVYVLLSGAARVTCDGEEFTMRTGQLLFVAPPVFREGVALETPTTVLVIGGKPGKN